MTDQDKTIENKDQAITYLLGILKVYGNPEYWGKLYGGFQNDQRIWLGKGQGWELASRAVDRVNNKEEGG